MPVEEAVVSMLARIGPQKTFVTAEAALERLKVGRSQRYSAVEDASLASGIPVIAITHDETVIPCKLYDLHSGMRN